MFKYLFLLLVLLPGVCLAQLSITGKVINLNDKKAVASASVFLNNTSLGNKTNDDGTFTLGNIHPGQYDLIVSAVGYQTYSKTLLLNSSNINIPEIGLIPKTIELNEVKIKSDANWEKYYAQFKRQFLGVSPDVAECKILNPDLLDLEYDSKTHILSASSADFLEIENKALGYKIKYKLHNFTYNTTDGALFYEGISLFQDLKGKDSKMRQWKKMREQAYLGSPRHFLRSILYDQSSLPQGFDVFRLTRQPNPDYKGEPNNMYIQNLVEKSLLLKEFANRTNEPGIFALGFKDCLYIIYGKKRNSYHPASAVSVATFREPYAFFDNNGIIRNPHSIAFEGDWGTYRIAELLPVDYNPDAAP
jgi:hypothetical protein